MGATDDSFTLSLQSTESNVKQTNRPMIQSDGSIPFFLLFLSGFILFYFWLTISQTMSRWWPRLMRTRWMVQVNELTFVYGAQLDNARSSAAVTKKRSSAMNKKDDDKSKGVEMAASLWLANIVHENRRYDSNHPSFYLLFIIFFFFLFFFFIMKLYFITREIMLYFIRLCLFDARAAAGTWIWRTLIKSVESRIIFIHDSTI